MTQRTGYFVKNVSFMAPFDIDEVLQVSSAHCDSQGNLYLGFDGAAIWPSEYFTEVVVAEAYDDSVTTYELPEPTIEITRKEYLALLDAEMWWHAALLGNVRDFCGWPDIMEHYLALKKEEKEMVND